MIGPSLCRCGSVEPVRGRHELGRACVWGIPAALDAAKSMTPEATSQQLGDWGRWCKHCRHPEMCHPPEAQPQYDTAAFQCVFCDDDHRFEPRDE